MDQFSPGCQGKPGSSGDDGIEHQSAGGAEEKEEKEEEKESESQSLP